MDIDMLSTIASDILDQLAGVTGAKSIGLWAGDIADLLKSPQNLPGLYLLYQDAKFEAPVTMGSRDYDIATRWQVVVVAASRKSPGDAATSAWSLIESVRELLIGHQVSTYNKLWPESEELLFAENGVLVYGLTYSLEVRGCI